MRRATRRKVFVGAGTPPIRSSVTPRIDPLTTATLSGTTVSLPEKTAAETALVFGFTTHAW